MKEEEMFAFVLICFVRFVSLKVVLILFSVSCY
jgi:hypothetical protein